MADFLIFALGGAVVEPYLVTLRITDDRQGKAEALVVRNRVFQLLAEEAHTPPYVVTSMYFLPISFIVLMFMLII